MKLRLLLFGSRAVRDSEVTAGVMCRTSRFATASLHTSHRLLLVGFPDASFMKILHLAALPHIFFKVKKKR
jgi:hypothetical protein